MPETKTYDGGCHCGAVRYTATTDLTKVIACNCSHCSKAGLVLTFVEPAHFDLKSGEAELTDYQFNKKVIHHLFCWRCGVQPFARGNSPDGEPMVALNVRCLDGVDLAALKPIPIDGQQF